MNRAEVLVKWHHGSPTWAPVSAIKDIDLVTLIKYAKDKNLTNSRGWKWARLLTSRSMKKIQQFARVYRHQRARVPIYQFGIRVPTRVKDAYRLDQANNKQK